MCLDAEPKQWIMKHIIKSFSHADIFETLTALKFETKLNVWENEGLHTIFPIEILSPV